MAQLSNTPPHGRPSRRVDQRPCRIPKDYNGRLLQNFTSSFVNPARTQVGVQDLDFKQAVDHILGPLVLGLLILSHSFELATSKWPHQLILSSSPFCLFHQSSSLNKFKLIYYAHIE